MIQAADQISVRKAPGIDGVLPEVVEVYMKERPGSFTRMANSLLRTGEFPTRWKAARLALLPKPGKPTEDPSSYRPLCLLDTTGKAFETLVARRLTDELTAKGVLSENQYGFRAGRSTVDAVREVLAKAEEERKKT